MNQYMLIFRHEDGSKIASPEQMQIWMKQTIDWINSTTAKNKFIGGNGLIFDGAKVVMRKDSNKIVTDGPFGDIKETIGGYGIFEAESFEEAVEIAKGSPVLQGEGNSVEVRLINGKNEIHENIRSLK